MIDAAKSRAARSDDPLDTPIELLPLSTRSINALRNYGVATLRDLGRCTRDDILRMKNLGVASVREIQESVRRKRGE